MAILRKPRTSWRWHLATVDDAALQLVPGTHRRYRTEQERRCLLETRDADIPGQLSIRLEAGQTVFWSGNTIHRGLNRKDTWRLRDDVRANLPAPLLPYYDRWRARQAA